MAVKNTGALIGGLILIGLGTLLLAMKFLAFDISWLFLLKLLIPALLVLVGCLKLLRHFSWSEEQLDQSPGKTSLLAGLFWLALGIVFLLDVAGVLESLSFIGLYWPALLIIFGAGKIVDYYRLSKAPRVRTAEVLGVIFIAVFGFTSDRLARAHIPLLKDLTLPILWPVPFETEQEKHEFESEQVLELQDIEGVEISNLYGDIRVDPGAATLSKVRLLQEVQSDTREEAVGISEKVALRVTRDQKVLKVTTNRQDLKEIGRKVNTNLIVSLPETMPVQVTNSYGSINLVGRKAGVSLTNSYGRITAREIEGDVEIQTRYQRVDVSGVQGSVTVTGRRSPVGITNVQGDVQASTDHENVNCRNIGGHLNVSNPYGTVNIDTVAGKISVEGKGSRVTIAHAEQDTYVLNSHRPIRIEHVSGNLEIDTSYSNVSLSDLNGSTELTAVHTEIKAKDVHGGLKIEGRGSKINLERIQGEVGIATSLRDVSVRAFTGPVSIQNEHGDIVLESRSSPSADIKAINKYGAISLWVPQSADFELSAQAVSGEIISDFGSPPLTSDGNVASLEAKVGKGGPKVELQTSQSRISVRRKG
jgi:DUF4097 and DUF4098 domain-containing protein YvlB